MLNFLYIFLQDEGACKETSKSWKTGYEEHAPKTNTFQVQGEKRLNILMFLCYWTHLKNELWD